MKEYGLFIEIKVPSLSALNHPIQIEPVASFPLAVTSGLKL